MSGPDPGGGRGPAAADGPEGDRPAGPAVAALVELSAALAAAEDEGLEEALRRAAGAADGAAVEEVILQSHLFLGFPAALAGMRAWRRLEVAGRSGAARRPDDGPDPAAWEARGEEVCRRVYGAAYERLRNNVRRLHPELDAWMIRDGYGKVLGRAGLDLATRELCIVATLAADGSVGEPLHSHLRGALLAGAEPGRVERALEVGLAGGISDEERRRALRLWRRVRERRSGAPHD